MKTCQYKLPKLKFGNDRKLMKTEQNVQKLWYDFKRHNIHAIAERGEREKRKIFDTKMSENISKFTTDTKEEFEEAHQTQNGANSNKIKQQQQKTKTEQNKSICRYIIFILQKKKNYK